MATWPTSPASTANLDAGTDRPSLARADLKNNVDNTNAIIDMFNITASPSNNSILKYSTSTSKFELTADADVNTTYAISAETATGGVNLRLTGSDASTDDVKFAEGTGITLTRTDANTITVASTISSGMTGFTAAGDSGTSQTISDGNTLTISGGVGLSSVASATDTITINLDNTTVTAASYTYASITVDAQGRITSASNGTTPLVSGGALGTPSSATLTNATGLPISTGVSGLGTSVATALAVNVGTAGAVVVNGGALGTPSSGTLTNATGLPISTGVSGLGTNVATALAVAVGSSGALVTNGGALGTPSSGTLTNATGLPISTGVSGLGSGIATFLATPSSTNLISAITDETGSGSLVFANTPTLVSPILGTPTSGNLSNTTVDGTNAVGYRNLPAVGTKTGSYTLATTDKGKYVQVGSGGSITIPDATFAEGDCVVIVNNHTAAITITCTITTAYIGGTDADKATVSLATRGLCNIFFLSGTVCVITGNVS